MVRMLLAAALIAAPAATGQEQGKKAKGQPAANAGEDRTAKILAVLHGTRLPRDMNVNESPLMDTLLGLTKEHNVSFVIREDLFKEEGVANVMESKPMLKAARLEGMTAHRFLTVVLKETGATYLVRDGHIEIVPVSFAVKEAGLEEAVQEAGSNAADPAAAVHANYRLSLPLMSVVAKDRPLDEVVTELARAYELNVVISPAAREQMKQTLVNERLLNVPADTLLELLAGLASQDVTRKGNTFRIGLGGGGQ